MNQPLKQQRPKGNVAIYFCGGTGINIHKNFQEVIKNFKEDSIANIRTYFVDSSDSDLTDYQTAENTYLIKDKDGGGKVRGSIYPHFSPKVTTFMDKFHPGDISIVVSSLGGGTGATIAYTIMEELLRRNCAAIAIGVTNTDSKIELENTIKAIASFENIAEQTGKPVILSPFQNDDSGQHSKVNNHIAYLVSLLCVLASRRNARLDTQDVYNWINYHNVTDVPPRLMAMVHCVGNDTLSNDDIVPISLATLAQPDTNINPGFTPDYQCVGYVSPTMKGVETYPAHFMIADGIISNLVEKKLKDALSKIDQRAGNRKLSERMTYDKDKGSQGFIA